MNARKMKRAANTQLDKDIRRIELKIKRLEGGGDTCPCQTKPKDIKAINARFEELFEAAVAKIEANNQEKST